MEVKFFPSNDKPFTLKVERQHDGIYVKTKHNKTVAVMRLKEKDGDKVLLVIDAEWVDAGVTQRSITADISKPTLLMSYEQGPTGRSE